MPDIPELNELRDSIDKVDDSLVDLLAKRAKLVGEVAAVKSELDIEPYQPDRFGAMKARLHLRAVLVGLDDPALVDGVWGAIHESSLAQQSALMSPTTTESSVEPLQP